MTVWRDDAMQPLVVELEQQAVSDCRANDVAHAASKPIIGRGEAMTNLYLGARSS
jgi:hypothetical protein